MDAYAARYVIHSPGLNVPQLGLQPYIKRGSKPVVALRWSRMEGAPNTPHERARLLMSWQKLG